ncbi:MAG: mechanosensitive ion channel family protein [Chitinophagales bacterium]
MDYITGFFTSKGIDLLILYGTNILFAIFVLIIGLWIIKMIKRLMVKSLHKAIKDEVLVGFLASLIDILLKVVLFIAIASMLGIQIASLLAILGSVGLAIGLALQGSLSNFAGGILILVFNPFKKGDFVTIKGIDGSITKIDLLYTTITTRLNRIVTIPNSAITNDVITNHSREENVRRRFYLTISYDSDIKTAKKAIIDAILSTPHILHDPGPFTEVSDLTETGITFRIFIWCKPADYFRVKEPAIENIKYEFDKQGISIANPRRTVYIQKGDLEQNS